MTPTHPHEILDLALLQRGTEGTAVLGRSTPVSVEIRATRRVRVTSVQFTLVHSLELTQMRGNQFGGTYHAAERSSKDIGSTLVRTGTTLREGESCFEVSQLMVPADAIPTLHGKLALSGWAVRVRVSSDGNPDVVRSQPLVVQSDGSTADGEPDTHPTDGRHPGADLHVVELSTRSVHPGVELSGVVTVGETKARALDISIVMQEEVMFWAGQRPQEDRHPGNFLIEETVIDQVRLPAHAARGSMVPFTLTAGTVPAPTVTSPVLRVRWFLRAALEVPFRRDPEVTVPLAAGTRIHSRA
ncbi:hypothetical protein [Arthrobacter antioxidans]|uniref:hypothetical protein n=1 Tax=Arthrobacter antioxidans TaxID=2895818 RepID=UPI001FFE6499|nr:hypothetical protein [Arthrobacter antioxidans]